MVPCAGSKDTIPNSNDAMVVWGMTLDSPSSPIARCPVAQGGTVTLGWPRASGVAVAGVCADIIAVALSSDGALSILAGGVHGGRVVHNSLSSEFDRDPIASIELVDSSCVHRVGSGSGQRGRAEQGHEGNGGDLDGEHGES